MNPHPLVVHLALVAVSVAYGANFVLSKLILEAVPARAWVFYRLASATLCLLPVALIWRRRLPPVTTWRCLFLASLLGVVANQVLFLEGLQRTTPAHSAVLVTSIPIWTLVFAVLARQERLTANKVAAILVALTGVLTLLEVDRWFEAGVSFEDTFVGDVMTLINAASFAAYLVLMRRLRPQVDPVMATVICFLIGCVVMAPWSAPALSSEAWQALTTAPLLYYALYAVVVATAITYLLNNWALKHTHSSQVALYIYLQPVLAATLSFALGVETPEPRFFLATAMVMGGILLHVRQ